MCGWVGGCVRVCVTETKSEVEIGTDRDTVRGTDKVQFKIDIKGSKLRTPTT